MRLSQEHRACAEVISADLGKGASFRVAQVAPPAPVFAQARRAGTIASRNGSATEAPMPRSRVRREMCLFVMNIAWTS
jgi:hypothetical protein